MIDICYVGNSSIDDLVINNKIYITLGGSAIYSSFSTRASFNGKIGIISKINVATKLELVQNNINFYGSIVKKMTEFSLDENKSTCEVKYYNNEKLNLDRKIETNHLHISFRKGVDIESILEDNLVDYNHLSVDVMIHSVEYFIPIIKKYSSKIEILFCNMQEYNLIKEYIDKITLVIITNENKPVLAVTPNCIKIYDVTNNNNLKSTTGAGDSFIGGFLSKYVLNQNLDESVSQGIYNSNRCIEKIGPLSKEKLCINKIIKPKLLPNNIIVIGNSCAGKTTFIDYFKNIYNIYLDIDDLEPLLEVFNLDDLIYKNKIQEFKNYSLKLKYANRIWEEYNNDISSINHYTKPSRIGKGHDIVRPILWDYIIQMAVNNSKSNNIIQFSRGRDELYESYFTENAYFRSIQGFIDGLKNKENCIIINLVSDLEVRKNRNKVRFEKGGHYVSDQTMDKVYSHDIFNYIKKGENFGFIGIQNYSIPVYTIINNKFLSEIELFQFLEYNVNEVIRYYNEFKESKKWN